MEGQEETGADEVSNEERNESGSRQIQVNFTLCGVEKEGEEQVLESKLCSIDDCIQTFKQDFARQWNQPIDQINISFQGETLSNTTTLNELGVGSDNTVTLMVQHPSTSSTPPPVTSPPPETTPLPEAPPPTGGAGGVLVTSVKVGQQEKEVLVKVDHREYKKPFLGGYRHRMTGVEYHNASAQTRPKKRPNTGVEMFERDAQTVVVKNKPQQVAMDAATQMNKNGCFMNVRGDKVLPISGVYETADEYHQRILGKVIILQSYWRRWLATCFVKALRADKLRREAWERQELERRKREREEHAKREFNRRMNPRTQEDFDLLYHALEMWRQEEIAHIDATTEGAERKAALCGLLEQEAELIASIGRHKIVADRKNKDSSAMRFLNKTAAPRRWTAFDGGITEMNTPFTLRAEQLRDLYSTLTMQGLSQEERLDILLTLKSTVKEHDCKLTRDIVELVDREADLLVRGIKPASLMGLRKRISSLFMQYCRAPLFNPEAAKYIKVPQDPATLCSRIYYCRCCAQYLPSTDFELTANSRYVDHCRTCRALDNKARAREDYSMYRVMLKALRRAEERFNDQSHIIFLLQEADLRYLVENIWAGQSALSACTDLYELRMVRWEMNKPWAPWNAFLVTQDEAASHAKLDDLLAAYGAQFVEKMKHKHLLAQNYFSRIPEMAEGMKERVRQMPLPISTEKEFTVIMNLGETEPQDGYHTQDEEDTITQQTLTTQQTPQECA